MGSKELRGKGSDEGAVDDGLPGAVAVGRGESWRATRAITWKKEGVTVDWTQKKTKVRLAVVCALCTNSANQQRTLLTKQSDNKAVH